MSQIAKDLNKIVLFFNYFGHLCQYFVFKNKFLIYCKRISKIADDPEIISIVSERSAF